MAKKFARFANGFTTISLLRFGLHKRSLHNRGFTLIELLIVVAIVAILSTVGISIYTNITGGVNDARVKGDINAIAAALEQQYNGTVYPGSVDDTFFSAGKKPVDPNGTDYLYQPGAGNASFRVCGPIGGATGQCTDPGPNCFCKSSTREIFAGGAGSTYQCDNDLDDDGDGFTDFPETGCDSLTDDDETDPGPPPDLISPTATITSPPAGPVSGTVTINVAANDDVAVDRVEFFIDVNPIGTDSTGPNPYSISWDSTTVPDGSHSLTARAFDTSSNSGNSSPVNVNVNNAIPQITYRSHSTATPGTTVNPLVITKPVSPAPVQSGDVMIAHIVARNIGTVVTPPAGWNLVRFHNTGASIVSGVYYKVATASEPASYSFAFEALKHATGGIVAYYGVNTSSPINANNGLVNTSLTVNLTAPSVTTTVANTKLLFFGGTTASTTVNPPSSMSEIWDIRGGSTPVTAEFSDQTLVATGATGSRVGTLFAANTSVGILVALTPQ